MPRVEDFAERRAGSDKRAFLAALGGPCVLIRLDERGGKDDPTPWAFQGLPRTVALPPRDDEAMGADELQALTDDTLDMPPRIGASDDSAVHPTVTPDDPTLTAAPPPLSTLRLPAARGAATVHVVPFPGEGPAILGRGEDAQVSIAERSVSKRHAHIRRDRSEFGLADLGSSNGTHVNGRRVQVTREVPLKNGDVVELGDVSLLFLDAQMFWDRLPDLGD